MNHIIQTGTDSEGNPITTTLEHEAQDFVNNQCMPRRRENNMVKTVKIKITSTDGTSANATHLVSGQADQIYSENLLIPLPWRAKANGELSGFLTPSENVTETIMLNWAKAIIQETDKADALNLTFATKLYGDRYQS